MSEAVNSRIQQIEDLKATLKLPIPDSLRLELEKRITALELEVAGQAVGQLISGSIAVNVGLNLGRIIYGRDPKEDEQRRLAWYLDALAAKLHRLPIRGLTQKLDDGEGIGLPQVYVMLATTNECIVNQGRLSYLHQYFQQLTLRNTLRFEYDPQNVLPKEAIVRMEFANQSNVRAQSVDEEVILWRSLLATEAVAHYRRLVLLGDPGSGKSTFLRHLAWVVAQRALEKSSSRTVIIGWEHETLMLPIFVSLRRLAGRIAQEDGSAATVFRAIAEEMQAYNVSGVEDLLADALYSGAALLMFDGLDEIPSEGIQNTVADRLTTLTAVRYFAQLYPKVVMIVTCRTRAFTHTLQETLGWHVETIAPFTFGQIRHFARSWYSELAARGELSVSQADTLHQTLITAIETGGERLLSMARMPLLLTLLAIVLYERNELPRDRPQLYERMLDLLLGQWDKVQERESISQAIGRPDWGTDRFTPVLDRLCYHAHLTMVSEDGHGRLSRSAVRDALIEFFVEAGLSESEAWRAGWCALDYFDQRSGLLMPDVDGTYVVAHLTFQEHCSGRAILLSPDAVGLVLTHRADDRWREPIFLGLGVVQRTNPSLVESILRKLIDPEEEEVLKPLSLWKRDLILAAEIGADRDWNYLRTQRVDVKLLQRELRAGLASIIEDRTQPLPVMERIKAGVLLSDLGDTRYPVSREQWYSEEFHNRFGEANHYWCFVRGDAYQIGGVPSGVRFSDIKLKPYWIARYPITVEQFAQFVAVGYEKDAERWWTPCGWKWKTKYEASQPEYWNLSSFNRKNQPITGVTWYEAIAYTAWLTEQLAGVLPEDYEITLCNEAEWEVAVAYDVNLHRHSYPWGSAELCPELAIYLDEQVSKLSREQERLGQARKIKQPPSVGMCPSGAAPCGAQDMVGLVWEWTASRYGDYPSNSSIRHRDIEEHHRDVIVRGGSWRDRSVYACCGARDAGRPDDCDNNLGFRVVVVSR